MRWSRVLPSPKPRSSLQRPLRRSEGENSTGPLGWGRVWRYDGFRKGKSQPATGWDPTLGPERTLHMNEYKRKPAPSQAEGRKKTAAAPKKRFDAVAIIARIEAKGGTLPAKSQAQKPRKRLTTSITRRQSTGWRAGHKNRYWRRCRHNQPR